MKQGLEKQFIRENYQRMSNEEIISIAKQDARGLTIEAQEVIKEEVERRGLDTNILKGVQAQNKSYTIEELDRYCNLIRQLPCPSCKTVSFKLNGTLTSEVMSFISFTQHKKKSCLS